MNDRELIGLALSARERTHSVYSGVAVGAAVAALWPELPPKLPI